MVKTLGLPKNKLLNKCGRSRTRKNYTSTRTESDSTSGIRVFFNAVATVFYDPLYLEDYDFSNARPGRHRGFKGSLVRVLEDGTEQAIESKPRNNTVNVERSQRQMSLLLDTFIVEYFEAKAGEQGVQGLINQVLAEYIHNCER
ncbi:hypothetical protein [Calothrix sp. PCC 7507]|uniref:hypothetical protein n=1 Tax=Calothrix sp. PCC 7507 TaxID=99598 RepID=UPI00029F15E8|nr:hypothetical protein [Calothrix sp. PCC 7507]AFY32454.1 hypothetical protein Cal7507_2010 [Calothrix sp. PCC 7507]